MAKGKGAPEPSIEKSKVVLVSFETDKDRYEAIKRMAELLGMTYEEAKEAADRAPVDLLASIPTEAAENLAQKLGEVGAVVEVLPLSKLSRFCKFHPHRGARAKCKSCDEYICDLCIYQSHGKLYCAEHYEIFKQKKVLRYIGGAFILLLVMFLGLLFRHPLLRTLRLMRPQTPIKVAAIFVTEHPNEAKSKYFFKNLEKSSAAEFVPGADHIVADIPGWFRREYAQVTGRAPRDVMRISSFGLYKIALPPPQPPDPSEFSYAALKHHREYTSYFKTFFKESRLNRKIGKFDLVLMVDLVDRTPGERDFKDFMEELGTAADNYAYVRVPIADGKWSDDYYIAAAAHFLGRLMGGRPKLTDKGFPLNPQGLADPAQVPPYPQSRAEIMACYRPIQEFTIERPSNLNEYTIGPLTAYEFGWLPGRSIEKNYPKGTLR